VIQQKQHRQIKQSFVKERHQCGIGGFPGGLQEGLAKLVQPIEGAGNNGCQHHDLTIGNHLGIVDKGHNNPVSGKKTDEGEKGTKNHRKNAGALDNVVHPFPAAPAAVVGNGRLHTHTDTHGQHGKQHSDFSGHTLGRQRDGAVAHHQPVGNHGGNAHQKRAAGKGKAKGGDGKQYFFFQGKKLWMQGKGGLFFQDIIKKVAAADQVPKNRRQGGACHVPGKDQDEQGIQADIGQRSQNVCNHGLLCRAVGPYDIGKDVVEQNYRGAQRNDAQVAAGKGKCIPVRAKGQGNRLYGKKDNEEKKKTDKQGTAAAKACIGFDACGFFFPKGQGNRGAAPASEERSQAGEDGEQRRTQRDGGDFYRIPGLADEKSIRHIINNHYQHNEYGGQAQIQEKLRKRCLFQHFLIFSQNDSLL